MQAPSSLSTSTEQVLQAQQKIVPESQRMQELFNLEFRVWAHTWVAMHLGRNNYSDRGNFPSKEMISKF